MLHAFHTSLSIDLNTLICDEPTSFVQPSIKHVLISHLYATNLGKNIEILRPLYFSRNNVPRLVPSGLKRILDQIWIEISGTPATQMKFNVEKNSPSTKYAACVCVRGKPRA